MNHDPEFIVSNQEEEFISIQRVSTGPRSAVGSEYDSRSREWEFDPGPVSYFHGDDCEIISTVILLMLIQEGLLAVTSKSVCTKYWLTA